MLRLAYEDRSWGPVCRQIHEGSSLGLLLAMWVFPNAPSTQPGARESPTHSFFRVTTKWEGFKYGAEAKMEPKRSIKAC